MHEGDAEGVWLALAKKGTVLPTSLTYDQALDEALCRGWIDGQKGSVDRALFRQRFSPRRRASLWSLRNVGIVEALIAAGRMQSRGQAEIDRAKADGRWDRAYAGAATATVPDDLAAALAASPTAAAAFATLSGSPRYSVLHPVLSAPSATARAARIARAIAKLEAPPNS